MRRVLIVCVALSGAAGATVWTQDGGDFSAGTHVGTEVDTAGALRLGSFAGANLALGARATSGLNSLTGSRSVTDGDSTTEWRFNNSAEVLGQQVTVDLGGDRGVTGVRIEPGQTVQQRPRFFLKGYRIEVAPEAAPDDWILVAQSPDNGDPLVDTTVDGAWIEVDGEGRPLPVLGRYVRMRITREDPPNWVSIGEVEVYGEGYRAGGEMVSAVLDAGRPVNFGWGGFAGEAPPGTQLGVQVRTTADTTQWEAWHRLPEWSLADVADGRQVEIVGTEPARFLQYRVSMATADPLVTPTLRRMDLAFDEALLAGSVVARIEPTRPVLGEETTFTYRMEATVDETDLGFDRVRIGLPGSVREVRIDGLPLPGDEFSAAWDEHELRVRLASQRRVARSAVVEVDFSAVLLRPTLAVWSGVALSSAGEPLNYQSSRPETEEAWTLIGRGVQRRVLTRGAVRVRPNPFDAAAGEAEIQLELGKVQLPQPVSVRVSDLSGRPVRTLWEGREVTAGRHRITWDGRDDAGRLVVPGIYLLRVRVQADMGDSWVGTVGVVY